MVFKLFALLTTLVVFAACSDDDPPPADAGLDALHSDGGDLGGDLTADAGPKVVAPQVDPTAVTIKEWMVGWIPSNTSDSVLAALRKGTFAYPKAGYDANKIHWSARTPLKNGGLGTFPAGVSWAVTKVTLTAPARLFVRSGPTYSVWINGLTRPGDVYASRRVWVPLPGKVGENLIAVRIAGGRGAPQAELWTTPDEVVLNDKDTTLPDLLVGDTAAQCVGVPLLNLTDAPIYDLTAQVVAGGGLKASSISYPALGPHTVTQLAFAVEPAKAFSKADEEVTLTLRLESASLGFHYERTLKLKTVGPDKAYRRSRISDMDGSCQYYGVQPPSGLTSGKSYALILSLHGAGVEAINQAKAYSQKDWAYVVAPTNRRRFGFDWEVWGRLDALEALAHAKKTFNIDDTKVYLAGHSMGGHGTWHVGVMHPRLFGALAPSAGWSSFYSYGGSSKPTKYFARTQAHSDTNTYLSNLSHRGVYILHGGADTNVPTTEGQNMYKEVLKHSSDVTYHEEPGMGHWWDGTKAKGTDCVDWPDLMAFLKARSLDPSELDFSFRTPAPWVSDRHSYVALHGQLDPYKDSTLTSAASGTKVTLTSANVRGMTLDGAVLQKKGVTTVEVDGKSHSVTGADIVIGKADGKKPGVYGPFNEVMYRPFCFVYADSAGASPAFAQYAAHLASSWAVIGNGQACSLPLSRLKVSEPSGRNLIFIGVGSADVGATPPLSWDATALKVGSKSHTGALAATFVRKGRLAAVMTTTTGSEVALQMIQPFTSRQVLPDYMVWNTAGVQLGGFFDPLWGYDATLER